MKTLTFLLPQCGPPTSGGYRTVLRSIDFLIKNGYTINIEILPETTHPDVQRENISRYNVISNIDSIEVVSGEQDTSADIYVATGWQTFKKVEHYKSKGKCVVFFCQDIEWKFSQVSKNNNLQKHVKNFYDIEIPTFTMSKFLGNYFDDQRILKSASLNVDTDIYYNQSQKRDGICLLYCNPKVKPHRLGGLVMKLAKSLAERYPEKVISLYGDYNIPDVGLANVKRLNLLNNEQLANLYNTSELGVVFSTTNPSRIAYEMVACGMPAIEADCEYTEYDMDSDAFVRTDPDHDTIINTIDDLLNDPKEMKRLQAECEIYSNNNFHKLAEEKRFLDFINIIEKKRNK
jgi:glycosyltransferase involved in cell wall biosynthesis